MQRGVRQLTPPHRRPRNCLFRLRCPAPYSFPWPGTRRFPCSFPRTCLLQGCRSSCFAFPCKGPSPAERLRAEASQRHTGPSTRFPNDYSNPCPFLYPVPCTGPSPKERLRAEALPEAAPRNGPACLWRTGQGQLREAVTLAGGQAAAAARGIVLCGNEQGGVRTLLTGELSFLWRAFRSCPQL